MQVSFVENVNTVILLSAFAESLRGKGKQVLGSKSLRTSYPRQFSKYAFGEMSFGRPENCFSLGFSHPLKDSHSLILDHPCSLIML